MGIAPRDLSVSGGELTPTLKVKRGEVMKSYAAAIDAMYESREKFVPFVPNAGAGSAQAGQPEQLMARKTTGGRARRTSLESLPSLWWLVGWEDKTGARNMTEPVCTIQYRHYV